MKSELQLWQELRNKYSAEEIRKANMRTACGCASCTKRLLEVK